jgi:hypothetical protein
MDTKIDKTELHKKVLERCIVGILRTYIPITIDKRISFDVENLTNSTEIQEPVQIYADSDIFESQLKYERDCERKLYSWKELFDEIDELYLSFFCEYFSFYDYYTFTLNKIINIIQLEDQAIRKSILSEYVLNDIQIEGLDISDILEVIEFAKSKFGENHLFIADLHEKYGDYLMTFDIGWIDVIPDECEYLKACSIINEINDSDFNKLCICIIKLVSNFIKHSHMVTL